MRDDDLALLILDYFTSGAARQDREATQMQAKIIRHVEWAIRNLDLDGLRVTTGRIQRVIEREKHLTYSSQVIEAALAQLPKEECTVDEEWSNTDDRFINPTDLVAKTNALLDSIYRKEE